MARWRLASLAAADGALGDVLCTALCDAAGVADPTGAALSAVPLPGATPSPFLAASPEVALDRLGRETLERPGAGADLLAAHAAQTRALRLVWELHACGGVALPADVVAALRTALRLHDALWS